MLVNWIPSDILKTRGRLGLTNMPGYHQTLGTDLDDLKSSGVNHIVCLQQAREFHHSRMPERDGERRIAIESRSMHFLHEPIRDFAAPTLKQANYLVAAINKGLEQGESIVVHCFAGLGRAGTIASCVLVSNGHDADSAVRIVRKHREGAVQTQDQYDFVMNFEYHFHKDDDID